MNMISTVPFLAEADATKKQAELVKALTAAWEKKNSKTARAGGVSLMALSLAACGGSDDTPFSQADIDTAVAAVDTSADDAAAILAAVQAVDANATTVAEVATNAAAAVDTSADDAAAILAAVQAVDANATTVAAVATNANAAGVASVDTTADDAAAISTALRDAAAGLGVTGTSTMTNAELITAIKTANDSAIAAAVDTSADDAAAVTAALKAAADDLGVTGTASMTDAQLITAIKTANDAAVEAAVDLTTNDTTAINAAVAADTSFTTLAELVAAYDALANPAAVNTSKNLTSNLDNISTTGGDDSYYALNAGDFATGDILAAGEGTDTLTATVASNATVRPVMSGIETINLTISEAAAGTNTMTLNLDQSSDVTSVNVYTHASTNTNEDSFVLSGVTTAATLTVTDNLGAGNLDNNYTVTYSGVTGTADTASVNVSAGQADLTLGTITMAGVENVTASASGGFDATYGLTAAAATTVTLNATDDTTAADTDAGTVSVTAVNATTLNVNAANDVTVSDATNGLVKVATVNIDSQTAGKAVTMTDIVTTNSAAVSETLTFNVEGAGDATLSAASTTWSANNANVAEDTVVVAGGSSTGNITYTTDTTVANQVTGGSGNDTVVLGGALDNDDTIALGDGTSDTITATAAFAGAGGSTLSDHYYTAATATDDPTISGVEVARINIATGTGAQAQTFDMATADFASTISINAASALDVGNNDITISNIGASQTVNLGSNLDLDSSTVVMTLADATGTSDTLNITTDGKNQTATATFEGITASSIETVTVDLASTATANTTVAGGALAFADATSVTLTGSKITSATVTAKDLATIDATGVTGATTLQFDNAAKDYTVKGSSTAATTFTMGTRLDDGDTIEGGAATTDSLTATIAGLTATTGALSISGVETIELDTATSASTVNAASITGASLINVGSGQNVTVTNLAADTNFTLGVTGSLDYSAALSVSLADATGSSDAITFNLSDTASDNDINANLTTSGIETVTLADAAAAGTGNNKQLNVANVDATTLVVSGGTASEVLDLTTDGASAGTLNAATATLNASAFDGVLTASAATNTATTFTAKTTVGTITGGAAADTITIGSTSNYIGASVGTVDAGAATDTLTVYAGSAVDLDGVTNVETINLMLDASDADGYTINGGGGSDGIITATTVNIDGGVAAGTYVLSATLTDVANKVIDAGDVVGSVTMTFGDDALVVTNAADPVTITGGQASSDAVTISMSGSNTGTFTMSGVETLNVGNDGTASTVNLANVTGLSTLILTDDGAGGGADVTVSNLASSTVVELGDSSNEFIQGATLNLSDATGSADTLTVRLVDTDSTGTADTVTANGVENLTINVKAGTEDHKIAVANTNANASTITVTGTDTDTTLELSSIASAITTVNAADFASTLTIGAAARDATAMTITGGTGADTIEMENASDVLTGGAGTSVSDDLHITFTGTGGAAVVDLSATDQITLFNGVANSTVQTGFEDIDFYNYTQTNSVGVDITGSSGANVIVGSQYADTIRGGAGDDVIINAGGLDTLTLGAGSDDVVFELATAGNAVTIAASDFDNSADELKFDATAFGITAANNVVVVKDSATNMDGADVSALGKVLVITDNAGFADYDTAEAAIDATANTGQDGFVIFYNSTNSQGEMYYDADLSNDAGEVLVAIFTGVTGGTTLAAEFGGDTVANSGTAGAEFDILAAGTYALA